MKFKRVVCLLLALAMSLTLLCGCNEKKPGPQPSPTSGLPDVEDVVEIPAIDFQDIAYEMTALDRKEDSKIAIKIKSSGNTGKEVTATVTVRSDMKTYHYFIVDWGDGTWSYEGPHSADQRNASVPHVYKKAGTYQVRAYCQALSSATNVGWSKPDEITISGDPISGGYLSNVKPIGSDSIDADHGADKISDNDNGSSWKSQPITEENVESAWVGYEFDRYYNLNTVEIKVPTTADSFPSDFSIEYTTDRGETWYGLPKLYYMFNYRVGRGEYYKLFPNPKGATLVLNLDGVVANGIRIVSKQISSGTTPSMEIAEMRVTGEQSQLFYSSLGGVFDADLNNMFLIYGTAATEQQNIWADPFRGGQLYLGSAEWINWNGIKLRWTTDEDIRKIYKNTFLGIRTGQDTWSGSDGFVWAVSGGQKHLDHQSHYTQNSLFIIEARNYLLMHNDVKNFLKSKNGNRQTIDDRLTASMNYMLTTLEGNSGVLTINDPENLAEAGYEAGSQSSNYWDRYSAFGYKSSYENVFFYQAVLSMIDIEMIRGNASKAAEYVALADKIKTEFNKLFWDEEKGRYITSVNKQGTRLDFGITFSNFMACAAGLASEEQAQKIYDWVDGKRIIEGDTSTGEDIYGAFKFSARSNTLDVSKIDDNGYYWVNWNGDMYCHEKDGATHGCYGNQMQNGGTIFYTSYYDLMGRLNYLEPDNAYERFQAILLEFHNQDQLRVFPYPTNIGYSAGVIGEFPESGMVPTVFVEGFVGILPGADGLEIAPKLPSNMSYAGVREYQFNEKVYNIKVDKNITEPTLTQSGDTWVLEVPANGTTWVLNTNNEVTAKS